MKIAWYGFKQMKGHIDLKQQITEDIPQKLQTQKCIYTCCHIIHHDANTAMDPLIEPGYGERFYDVKDSEKDKTK